MKNERGNGIDNEEPQLFEEKSEIKGKRRQLFIVIAAVLGASLLWPRGVVKGEAVLQADQFTKIGLASSGVLKELAYKKGMFVKKGDWIARFENRELSKRCKQQILFLEKLNESKSILQGIAQLQEKEKGRKQILFENGAIGRASYEKAILDASNAAKELILLEKEIQSTEEEVQYLKMRTESLELKAPFNGILLTDPSDHLGNTIKEGEFVLEMADPETYFLEALISERDIQKIGMGSKVKVRFHAFPWKTYSGMVVNIAPRTTEEVEKVFKVKHVIPCEIQLDEVPKDLKYGMRASVAIQPKKGAA